MKHFKCRISTIKESSHRYPTTGDWYFRGDALVVKVSKLEDWRAEFLCAIHELVEAALCYDRGITPNDVDEFDMNHLDLEEPGESSKAPYHKEHMIAFEIEKILARHLQGVLHE